MVYIYKLKTLINETTYEILMQINLSKIPNGGNY